MMADWMQEQQLLAQLLDRPTPKTAEAPPPPRTQPAGTPPLKSAQWLADETTAWA
jgi:hypothetical protein